MQMMGTARKKKTEVIKAIKKIKIEKKIAQNKFYLWFFCLLANRLLENILLQYINTISAVIELSIKCIVL